MNLRAARHFWTTTELTTIRRDYPAGGLAAVEPQLVGRTRSAIYQQARLMRLRSPRQGDSIRSHHPVTPEIDEAIRQLHTTTPKKGDVKRLAERLGRPVYWVSKRARELGLVTPRFREAPWSQAELDILDDTAELTPHAARLRLKRAGFERSVTAVVVKRKRVGLRVQPDGSYSAREAAHLLGYEESVLARWIRLGRIKASTAGADRSDGRTTAWRITPRVLREFIVNNPMAVQLRRIPAAHQPWLIELLSGRGPATS